MTELLFRKARREDLPAIVALIADDGLGRRRENLSDQLPSTYVAAFEALERDDNQLPAVVDRDGDVMGYMQITFIPGLSRQGMWRGQLESVRIASSLRGRGIGKAFFEWAIDQCRVRGCGLVQLTTDKRRADAHRFYEDLGFIASHEGMKLSL